MVSFSLSLIENDDENLGRRALGLLALGVGLLSAGANPAAGASARDRAGWLRAAVEAAVRASRVPRPAGLGTPRPLDARVAIAEAQRVQVRPLHSRVAPRTGGLLASMGYRYHTETSPLVRFEFIERLTAQEADRYFADAKSLLVPEVEFARRQANWMRDNKDEIHQLNRGIALVIPSALIRGLLRAIMHFQEIPAPHALFDELDEATAWAEEQLAR